GSGNVNYAKIQAANASASAVAPIMMQPDGGNVVLGLSGSTSLLVVNGKVGINNSVPSSNLDVGGTIHATGTITSDAGISAAYQDVAEWVPATEVLDPGTVVILNPAR